MEVTGYHYTSLTCWKNIQRTGLVPYTIIKPTFREHLGSEEAKGIWIWMDMQYGLAHRGCILYQMATKNTTQAVLLAVTYDDDNVLSTKEGWLKIWHSGNIEKLEYHTGHDAAIIVTVVVPSEKIKLLHEYDLLKIWR